MYEITIEDSFDAAHLLPDYQGNCSRLHGHTYKVQAHFRTLELDKQGMAIDFRKAKKLLRSVLDYIDHHYINELPEFSDQNPTAENVARFIYDQIKPKGKSLYSVSVWETPTSCATYFREDEFVE
jgi:6-pyruvoyltetrahydropterin/6-carboxytetrahydropterin synthase